MPWPRSHSSSLCFLTSAPCRNLLELPQAHPYPPGRGVSEPPKLLSPGPWPLSSLVSFYILRPSLASSPTETSELPALSHFPNFKPM